MTRNISLTTENQYLVNITSYLNKDPQFLFDAAQETGGVTEGAECYANAFRHKLLSREEEVSIGKKVDFHRLSLMRLVATSPDLLQKMSALYNPHGCSYYSQFNFAPRVSVKSKEDGVQNTRDLFSQKCLALAKWMRQENSEGDKVSTRSLQDELSLLYTDLPLKNAPLKDFIDNSPEEQAEPLLYHYKKIIGQQGYLVSQNFRLVASIAWRYVDNGFSFNTLMQEGVTGCLKAAERWDSQADRKFSTFATYQIKADVLEVVLKKGRLVSFSKMNRKKLSAALEKRKQTSTAFTEEEGVLVNAYAAPVSLNTTLSADHERTPLIETLVDERSSDPSEGLYSKKAKAVIQDVLKSLNERERYILENRVMSDSPKKLEDIGNIYSVSMKRIHQVEVNLIKKLKKNELLQTLIDGNDALKMPPLEEPSRGQNRKKKAKAINQLKN